MAEIIETDGEGLCLLASSTGFTVHGFPGNPNRQRLVDWPPIGRAETEQDLADLPGTWNHLESAAMTGTLYGENHRVSLSASSVRTIAEWNDRYSATAGGGL